jgi:hypothetical protein
MAVGIVFFYFRSVLNASNWNLLLVKDLWAPKEFGGLVGSEPVSCRSERSAVTAFNQAGPCRFDTRGTLPSES